MLVGSFELGQASDDLEELVERCENRMHTCFYMDGIIIYCQGGII
jgi:hypothetical protein